MAFKVELPTQMTMEEYIALQELEAKVEGPTTIFSVLQLSTNLVMAYGLKFLWNMINLLQFLVFFQFWKINIHFTVNMIITQIRKLAIFEFIDTRFMIQWIKSILGIELKDSVEAQKVTRDYCDLEKRKDCSIEDFLNDSQRYLRSASNPSASV